MTTHDIQDQFINFATKLTCSSVFKRPSASMSVKPCEMLFHEAIERRRFLNGIKSLPNLQENIETCDGDTVKMKRFNTIEVLQGTNFNIICGT